MYHIYGNKNYMFNSLFCLKCKIGILAQGTLHGGLKDPHMVAHGTPRVGFPESLHMLPLICIYFEFDKSQPDLFLDPIRGHLYVYDRVMFMLKYTQM